MHVGCWFNTHKFLIFAAPFSNGAGEVILSAPLRLSSPAIFGFFAGLTSGPAGDATL